MSGQHGRDGQPRHERIELGIRPADTPQPRDGVRDRIVQNAVSSSALPASQRPHPTTRLGEVHEPEVQREGTDDGLGGVEIHRPKLLVEAGALERIVVAPESDRPASDPFHGREELGPGLLGDDLAQQGTEKAHLRGKGVARACRPDAEGFGCDGR